jgi:hypothetical protein
MYAYTTVDIIKSTGDMNTTGTALDTRLRQVAEGVTRQFDQFVNRTFHPLVGTRYFSGDGGTEMLLPDTVAISSIKEDSNDDGTFDTTWSSTDYYLTPYNSDPTSDWGHPYQSIEVNRKSNGTQDVFINRQRSYQVVGTWGYSAVTRDARLDASADWNTSYTTLTLNGSVGTSNLGIGMTILVDSEQMYIEDFPGSATSISVIRASNGSTAGSHGSGAGVSYYTYPAAITEAAMIQTTRLLKRKDSGYSNEVGFPESGMITTFRGTMDGDVKTLLSPYRKIAL